MSERLRKVLMAAFALLFVVSAGMLIRHYAQISAGQNRLKKLAEIAGAEAVQSTAESRDDSASESGSQKLTPARTLSAAERYDMLHGMNADFLGWLAIDGTEINYPVMHTPEQPEKYLRRDFYGKYSLGGSLFLDGACRTGRDATDNWIIYGHNMRTTSMFTSLLKYDSEDYWKEHPTVRFEVEGTAIDFEVLGAFYTRILAEDEEGFRYYTFIDAASQQEFDAYVRQVKALSAYDTGVGAAWGDQLLTLSTCSYHTDEGRFVVICRAQGENARENAENP